MLLKKFIILLLYSYGISIIIYRTLYSNEIEICSNDNISNSKLNFYKMSIVTTFFISFSSFCSLSIIKENKCFLVSFYILNSMSCSCSFIHLLFYVSKDFPIYNCSNKVQIMNILLSIPGSLFCMILISFISVGIILALSIIILGMYDLISCYITNMNKLFNVSSSLWCISSIFLLFYYSVIIPVRIINSIQTVILLFVLIIARNEDYSKKYEYINIVILLGLISFVIEKGLSNETTPVTINGLLPSSIILFYIISFVIKQTNKIQVEENAIDNSDETLPPAVYASGGSFRIV